MWLSIALFVALTAACSGTKEAEMETKDELADFRNWVNTAAANVADRTQEDWQRAKDDFRMRTQELDQVQDNFTDEVKQEYQQLKQEFNDADARYTANQQEGSLVEWQSSLLGNWADMQTIDATNVREAYITFMENVRQNKGTWSDADWEMAGRVLESLNQRKSELSDVPTDSEVKIKALQIEFQTLETAADARDDN